MDTNERIIRYLSACPPAIQGQDGSGRTFAVACSLWNGFGLDEAQTLHYLKIFNDRCQPPWREGELEHKARDAAAADHTKVRGHLIGGNGTFKSEDFKSSSFPKKELAPKVTLDPETEIEKFLQGFRCTEGELADASPIRFDQDWTEDGILLVSNLYHKGELINYVTQFQLSDQKNGLTKANPVGRGESVERDDLCLNWSMTGMPQSEAGGWQRMNPLDGAGVADKNVTAFRYILLEFDSIPLDLQMSLLAKLPLPIAAILTSGGRSVHAWCKADCADADDYRKTAARLLSMLTKFGLDAKNKNPSRLSRLAGVTRTIGAADDGRQRLLYLSPNPAGKPIL